MYKIGVKMVDFLQEWVVLGLKVVWRIVKQFVGLEVDIWKNQKKGGDRCNIGKGCNKGMYYVLCGSFVNSRFCSMVRFCNVVYGCFLMYFECWFNGLC